MRLLVDANLSPRVAARLREAGHEAVHVSDLGLLTAPDDTIMARAIEAEQVVVTADTDFGELLAVSGADRPSVVLLRSADLLTPDQQALLLTANLPGLAEDLDSGAVVSMGRGRLRLRSLPIRTHRQS